MLAGWYGEAKVGRHGGMDGWMFVDEAMWADCRATTSKRVNLVTRLEGKGGTKGTELAQLRFWNNSQFGKKSINHDQPIGEKKTRKLNLFGKLFLAWDDGVPVPLPDRRMGTAG